MDVAIGNMTRDCLIEHQSPKNDNNGQEEGKCEQCHIYRWIVRENNQSIDLLGPNHHRHHQWG